MTAAEELQDSLTSFARSCNENARLMAMIRDWNRVLHLHADDLREDHTLTTQGGTVTTQPGVPPAADLTVRATADILTQVFYGELSPNEPYNAGTLRIQGAEEDIVRLDFVIAMLWE
jgi:putative sterol carrier protein